MVKKRQHVIKLPKSVLCLKFLHMIRPNCNKITIFGYKKRQHKLP